MLKSNFHQLWDMASGEYIIRNQFYIDKEKIRWQAVSIVRRV